MKVAIIGTSSSVSKEGYATAMSKLDGIDVVVNASMGASHSALIPFMIGKLDGHQPDILIIDVCLNEQRGMILEKYNTALIEDLVLFTLAECAKRGIIPVYLISPEDAPSRPEADVIREIYLSSCRRHGVPYFDGNAFIFDYMADTGAPIADLFIDWAHTKEEVSHHLAVSMRDAMAKMLESARTARRWNMVRNHISSLVKADDLIKRSSHLLSCDVLRITKNDVRTIRIPPFSEVIAIVLNAGETSATLHMGKVAKRFDNVLYRTAPFRMVTWIMLKPFISLSGNLKLWITPSAETLDAETNDHIDTAFDVTGLDDHVVEISAFIVRRRALPRRTITVTNCELDIYSVARRRS